MPARHHAVLAVRVIDITYNEGGRAKFLCGSGRGNIDSDIGLNARYVVVCQYRGR